MRALPSLSIVMFFALASCDAHDQAANGEASAVKEGEVGNLASEAVSPPSANVVDVRTASQEVLSGPQYSGAWACAGGPGDGIIQKLPPQDVTIDRKVQYFAPKGSLYQVALARGGPTGMYVRGHLHGIHNDRSGRTHYAAATMIRDSGGFYYAVLPRLTTTVSGSASRPEQHKHCGGQFQLSEALVTQLNKSIQSGNSIHLEFGASRDRLNPVKTFEESAKGKIDKFLKEEISEEDLLKLLNA